MAALRPVLSEAAPPPGEGFRAWEGAKRLECVRLAAALAPSESGSKLAALQTLPRPSPSLSVLGRPEPRRRGREFPYSFREFDGSGLLVDVAPVPDVEQENPGRCDVAFIQDPIVANAQTTFFAARQSMMRESGQPRAHVVDPFLNGLPDGWRQSVEGATESGRPDLQGGGHGSLRLPRAKVADGDFSARLVELGFDLIGQLKTVFVEVVEPSFELFQFVLRESGNGRFNFLHRAHADHDSDFPGIGKLENETKHSSYPVLGDAVWGAPG